MTVAIPEGTQLTPLAAEVKKLIKEHIGAKAKMSDADVVLFGHYCQGKGVDPLSRLILPIRMKGRLTFYSTIDYLRARAGSTGLLASTDIAYVEGQGGTLVSATATVHKVNKLTGQTHPTTALARWAEYADTDSHSWQQYPYVMLAKCAEALALRRAFPEQLHGLYVLDELRPGATPISPPPPTREDVTEQVGAFLGAKEVQEPPAEEAVDVEPEELPPIATEEEFVANLVKQALVAFYPTRTAPEQRAKTAIIVRLFGVSSWAEVERLPAKQLGSGLDCLKAGLKEEIAEALLSDDAGERMKAAAQIQTTVLSKEE